ncbi:dephospho-CoA kinase [Paenibacillus sp. strain BS8-2]
MIIGLTGGIASGKSTVGRLLAERGAKLVDADEVAREIVRPGEPALEAIASLFGQAILHPEGTLDRQALGKIVFHDKEKLSQLEAITHPAIRQRMQSRIHSFESQNPGGLVVADIPLLYETKQEALYQGIMVVYVPVELQHQRLMDRNSMSPEEATRRISLQMDIEEKRKRADWLINNSGSLEETERQVQQFWDSQGFV